MKRVLLFFLLFLFLPNQTYAQSNGWVIDDFKSDVIIQKDGKVAVHEIITTDFSDSKHGIYRDIPYVYTTGNKKTYTDITLGQVYQDDRNATVDLSEINGYKRIKIGDSSRTLIGKHTYDITYVVTGVLRSFTDHDELYWNMTGNNWEVPIEKASATVTLADGSISKISCFEGYTGSSTPCMSALSSSTNAQFTTQQVLEPSMGLTVAVAYPKGLIPILSVSKPTILTLLGISSLTLMSFFIVLFLGMTTLIMLWTEKGRDFWYSTRHMFDPNGTPTLMPFFAHHTVSVEFSPPDNLRPAEVGVLIDESADTLDVTATIIDLATRGFVSIKEIPKSWAFGSIDYELKKEKDADETLLIYEKTLLKKLFADSNVVFLSALKNTFYTQLQEVKNELYDQVMARKLFISRPDSVRYIYRGWGIFLGVIGMMCVQLTFHSPYDGALGVGAALVIIALILIPFSHLMPRRSAPGEELYQRVKGYKLFIGGAEQYRQQFYEKKNMFNEVLPYAIVLGLTGKFAKAMQDMGIQPDNPSWYTGAHAFSPVYFASNINSFSDSISAVMASTPSNSGGFSGGGSGGGFGGGGGGSW